MDVSFYPTPLSLSFSLFLSLPPSLPPSLCNSKDVHTFLTFSFQTKISTEVTPQKLKILSGSSEIVANVLESSLESSVELASEVALSESQNNTTGADLMAHHLSSLKHLPLQPGEKKAGSAFFRPISVGHQGDGGATDEVKLVKSLKLVKPTPTIFVNDKELRLSPLTPPYATTSGKTEVDPSEEVQAIFEGKLEKMGEKIAEGVRQQESQSPSSMLRKSSINQLQRLQQHMRVPHIGGQVCTMYVCIMYVLLFVHTCG